MRVLSLAALMVCCGWGSASSADFRRCNAAIWEAVQKLKAVEDQEVSARKSCEVGSVMAIGVEAGFLIALLCDFDKSTIQVNRTVLCVLRPKL